MIVHNFKIYSSKHKDLMCIVVFKRYSLHFLFFDIHDKLTSLTMNQLIRGIVVLSYSTKQYIKYMSGTPERVLGSLIPYITVIFWDKRALPQHQLWPQESRHLLGALCSSSQHQAASWLQLDACHDLVKTIDISLLHVSYVDCSWLQLNYH